MSISLQSLHEAEYKPLIHCITNPISMMQCANAILGLGARPIMAEHPLEVNDITATADALLINLGNISESRMEAIEISFAEALGKDIPVVIDAVGISCSELRRDFLKRLLEKRKMESFLLIKGNYSEIMALYDDSYKSEGVDAKAGIRKEQISSAAKELVKRFGALILASGKTDVIAWEGGEATVNNGCAELSMITGTGCMLGAICATILATKRDVDSVIDACAMLGIAGEMSAETKSGTGTFLVRLLDNISLMTDELLNEKKSVDR